MKTGKATIIIAIVILLGGFMNSRAETVYFIANNVRNGNIIKPDSIRVINLSRNRDTIIRTNSFFIPDTFSLRVNDEPDKTGIAWNEKGNDLRFEIDLEKPSDVAINAYTITGERITSSRNALNAGSHVFRLNSNALNIDMYFLTIDRQGQRSVIKFIGGGNPSSEKPVIELVSSAPYVPYIYELANSTDKFDFICYARHFAPDTVSNIDLQDGDTIRFHLKNINGWVNPGGHLKIDSLGLNVKYIRQYEEMSSHSEGWDTDRVYVDLSRNYILEDCQLDGPYSDYIVYKNIRFLGCKGYVDSTDNCAFCCEKYISNNDTYESRNQASSQFVTVSMDTANKTIRELVLHTFVNSYVGNGGSGSSSTIEDIRTDFEIVLRDIPYRQDHEGSYTFAIKGKDIKKYIGSTSYNYSRTEYLYFAYAETKPDNFSLEINDKTTITLELIK